MLIESLNSKIPRLIYDVPFSGTRSLVFGYNNKEIDEGRSQISNALDGGLDQLDERIL